MFEFEYPYVLALLPLFIVGAKYFKPKEDALLLPGVVQKSAKKSSVRFIAKWLGILFFVLALSSPISKDEFIPNKNLSHAIILAMDSSSSMQERMRQNNQIVNKFIVAKELGSEFIKRRDKDHVGIVAFGTFAYVATPLTFDTKASSSILERLEMGVAGESTALRDALFMSARMLKKSKAKEKVVVILTDGYDTASKIPAKSLLRSLEKEHVKVYTIGIGNSRAYDARFLHYIAKQSGGKFYQAINGEDLENVYKEIDALEKSELEDEGIEQVHYWFEYPLFLSFLSFILFLFLRVKRSKS